MTKPGDLLVAIDTASTYLQYKQLYIVDSTFENGSLVAVRDMLTLELIPFSRDSLVFRSKYGHLRTRFIAHE